MSPSLSSFYPMTRGSKALLEATDIVLLIGGEGGGGGWWSEKSPFVDSMFNIFIFPFFSVVHLIYSCSQTPVHLWKWICLPCIPGRVSVGFIQEQEERESLCQSGNWLVLLVSTLMMPIPLHAMSVHELSMRFHFAVIKSSRYYCWFG